MQPTCYELAIDSENRFITAGDLYDFSTGKSSFLITRLLPDSTVDSTFGTGGYISLAIDSNTNAAYDMKLQSDGKIVVAGFAGNKIALARFDNNSETAPVLETGDIAGTSNVKLYPNPAKNYINIDLGKNDLGNQDYAITDINGRIVKSGKLPSPNNNINIEQLESGVYFIKLESKTSSIKFIKL